MKKTFSVSCHDSPQKPGVALDLGHQLSTKVSHIIHMIHVWHMQTHLDFGNIPSG